MDLWGIVMDDQESTSAGSAPPESKESADLSWNGHIPQEKSLPGRKRRRFSQEGPAGWVAHVKRVFSDLCGASFFDPDTDAVVMETLCSGLGTASYSLKVTMPCSSVFGGSECCVKVVACQDTVRSQD